LHGDYNEKNTFTSKFLSILSDRGGKNFLFIRGDFEAREIFGGYSARNELSY